MRKLRFLNRIASIPQHEWDALALQDDSPFVEWTWLDCLEQAGCVGRESGWYPCHVALYEEEKLIAAAPGYLKTNSEGEFVFDWSWADFSHRLGVPYYPKLVLAVPFTPATGARVLVAPSIGMAERKEIVSTLATALVEHAAKLAVHGIHVLFPPAEEAALFSSAGYLTRLGVQYHFHNRGYGSFEDFLKDLPSKRRTQIRREMRQPEQDGIFIETLGPTDYSDEVAAEMYKLYLSTVDKFTWGRRYLNREFFALVAARFRERLSWVVARKEGRIIAGAFNLKKGRRLYGRYFGTFVELPFLHFNVCYYHGIRQCIAEGIEVFEPGAGGEHKRPRGFRPTMTYSVHHMEDARLREVLRNYLERERADIRARIEECRKE